MSGKAPPKKRRWRRFVLILLLIPLLPVVAFLLYNRIDEAPNSEVRYYESLPSRSVPDQNNAWLHLMGIGAPEGDDPVAYGHQRWQAYETWLRQSKANEAYEPQPEAVPLVLPDKTIDGVDAYCDDREEDCIAWVGKHEDMVFRLGDANSLRLQRYERLLGLSDWHDLSTPSLEEPFPSIGESTLRMSVVAWQGRHDLLQFDTVPAFTVNRLAQEVSFWRNVMAHPQELITVLRSARQVERAQRLLDDIIGRPNRFGEPFLGNDPEVLALVDQILTPLPMPPDYSEAIKREYRMFDLQVRQAIPGPLGALGECFQGSAPEGCLKMLAMSATYNHSATMNLHAIHRRLLQRMLEAPASEIERVTDELGPEFQATFIHLDEPSVWLREINYNYSGRILAQIAIPAVDYHYRLYDQEAYRRMLLIKRDALLQGIKSSDMPAFVEASVHRNPYTGEPFDWSVENRLMYFRVRATKYWPNPGLMVLMPDDLVSDPG